MNSHEIGECDTISAKKGAIIVLTDSMILGSKSHVLNAGRSNVGTNVRMGAAIGIS